MRRRDSSTPRPASRGVRDDWGYVVVDGRVIKAHRSEGRLYDRHGRALRDDPADGRGGSAAGLRSAA